jgi:hypothetical protein
MNVVEGKYELSRGMIEWQDRPDKPKDPCIIIWKGEENVARVYLHPDLKQHVLETAHGYCLRVEAVSIALALMCVFELAYSKMEDGLRYTPPAMPTPKEQP